MPVLSIAPQVDFAQIEAGYYTATVKAVTQRDRPADKYHDQPYTDLEFLWEVALPDGQDPMNIRSWATVTRTLNDKATLTGIVRAIGVADADGLNEPDTDKWVGRRCKLNIIEKVKEDGSVFNKVDGYAAIKTKAGAAPVKSKAPAPPVDDADVF